MRHVRSIQSNPKSRRTRLTRSGGGAESILSEPAAVKKQITMGIFKRLTGWIESAPTCQCHLCGESWGSKVVIKPDETDEHQDPFYWLNFTSCITDAHLCRSCGNLLCKACYFVRASMTCPGCSSRNFRTVCIMDDSDGQNKD